MKRKLMSVACALAMVANGVGALAQGSAQERARVEQELSNRIQIETFGTHATYIPFEMVFPLAQGGGRIEAPAGQYTWSFEGAEYSFGGKVIKGAPYSADAVTETVQVLGDGNRIVRHTASKIYRDGEGRERREQSLNAVGPWVASGEQPQTIFINDPVSGVNYILDPDKQTARKLTATNVRQSVLSNVSEEMKAKIEKEAATARAGAVGGAGGRGGTIQSSGATENRVTGGVATAVPVPAQGGGGRGGGFGGGGGFVTTMKYEPKTESLGKQMVGGVEAEGTRTTITIPAGAIGNEAPINIISERWYSPELQVVVMTKNSDPRTGETTYRLNNIVRSEPSASLFQVPSGYKVMENDHLRIETTAAPMMRKKIDDK